MVGMTDMKKSRYSEEQIIGFLKQAVPGMPIKELCHKGGLSDSRLSLICYPVLSNAWRQGGAHGA
jgi:hypothetical protein